MVRLADGDRTAFDPVFQALWPLVTRFTQRALAGSPDADDAAQAALLKVFTHAALFDPERDAVTWVLGITAYECKTIRKRQQRRREAAPALLEQQRTEHTPEDEVVMRDLEAAALSVMGTLGPADIETLHTLIEGGPRAVSGATFRKRLQRALERLRAAWSSRHDTD